MRFEEMRAARPAFDVVPYAEALRRKCAALRTTDGSLLLLLGDPCDPATGDWIEERTGIKNARITRNGVAVSP